MDIKKEMQTLSKSLNDAVNKYNSLVKEYESSDHVVENENLKKELNIIKKEIQKLEIEYKRIKEENSSLRLSLNEQILDERTSILKISQKKREIFFKKKKDQIHDRLYSLEYEINKTITSLEKKATSELADEQTDIISELNRVKNLLIERILEKRRKIEVEEQLLSKEMKKGYEALQKEPLDEETLQKRMRQNKLELKIGLTWFNVIGIGCILVGVGYASYYSYIHWFNPILKSITFYIFGLGLLVVGEYLYKKGKDIFSLGLIGGGIAVLYSSAFVSHFLYEIISFNIALVLMLLITLAAVVLCIRYNSQIIAGIALVGGYLPLITFIKNVISVEDSPQTDALYGILGYLFILNVLMLLISFFKRWNTIKYISFILYISCLLYLIFDIEPFAVSIIYSVLTFGMFQVIVLLYPLKYKLKLTRPDIVLLGLNTFISCIVIYALFQKAELDHLKGFLALLFALIYVGLGQFVQRVMKQEKETLILFYVTSLTFAILMVPFQFGRNWLSFGWLIEGVILTIMGFRQKFKYMEYAGWGITALCIVIFGFEDFFPFLINPDSVMYFKLKYTSIITGMIILMFIYLNAIEKDVIPKYSKEARIITGYKYFVVFSFWIFLNIVSIHYYNKLIKTIQAENDIYFINHEFYKSILIAIIHILLAYGLSKIRNLYDKIVQYFSVFLYIIAIFICFSLNNSMPTLEHSIEQNSTMNYVALVILFAFNILVIFLGRELLLRIFARMKWNLEFYPLAGSVYLLGVITSFVVVQFRLGDINLLLSFIYLIFAIGCIVYGFKKKYSYIRLFGLGLTVFSLAKLLLWDLKFLETKGRIIAFFGFGICLLAISFIYQKIKNILEVPDVKINE